MDKQWWIDLGELSLDVFFIAVITIAMGLPVLTLYLSIADK